MCHVGLPFQPAPQPLITFGSGRIRPHCFVWFPLSCVNPVSGGSMPSLGLTQRGAFRTEDSSQTQESNPGPRDDLWLLTVSLTVWAGRDSVSISLKLFNERTHLRSAVTQQQRRLPGWSGVGMSPEICRGALQQGTEPPCAQITRPWTSFWAMVYLNADSLLYHFHL